MANFNHTQPTPSLMALIDEARALFAELDDNDPAKGDVKRLHEARGAITTFAPRSQADVWAKMKYVADSFGDDIDEMIDGDPSDDFVMALAAIRDALQMTEQEMAAQA